MLLYDTALRDSQLKRWVERGKEDEALATATLPPPPVSTNGLQGCAIHKRRSVAQRYKLQDNLRVGSTDRHCYGSGPLDSGPSKGLLLDNSFLLMPQAACCGSGGTAALLSSLHRRPDDDGGALLVPSSGPPSACSDCSSADGSGSASPSTRSSSVLSLTNELHATMGATSSSGESACDSGCTEDTAFSPEHADNVGRMDLHDLLAAAARAPFAIAPTVGLGRQGYAVLPPPPSLLEPDAEPTLQAGTAAAARCEGAGSMSILCNLDSAAVIWPPCRARGDAESASGLSRTAVAPPAITQPPAVSRQVQQLELQSLHHYQQQQQQLAGAAAVHDARDLTDDLLLCSGSEGGGGGCGSSVLSRSSSLALSFADLVHRDSLTEHEMLFREVQQQQLSHPQQQQQPNAASVVDGQGAVCSSAQQQEKARQRPWAPQGSGSAADDMFSFAPVSIATSGFAAQRGSEDGAGVSLCRWCGVGSGSRDDANCGSLLGVAGCVEPAVCVRKLPQQPQPQPGPIRPGSAAASPEPPAVAQPLQGPGPTSSSMPVESPLREAVTPSRSSSESSSTSSSSPVSSSSSSCVAVNPAVDLTAVDSAVQLLKQLRVSLLVASGGGAVAPDALSASSASNEHRPPGADALHAASVLNDPAAARGAATQPAAGAIIGASLAQAAQKLAGLGLLPSPPPRSDGARAGVAPPAAPLAVGSPSPSGSCAVPSGRDAAVPSAHSIHTLSAAPAPVSAVVQTGLLSASQARLAPRTGIALAAAPLSTAAAPLPTAPRCKALLRRMQADWSRVRDQVGGVVEDYSALARQVAAMVSLQTALQRRCAAVRAGNAALARQLAAEREAREAVEAQLGRERGEREALAAILAAEREASAALVAALRREEVERAAAVAAAAEAAEAGRAEMDELLLCLGQESSKVEVLVEALRAAGQDPEGLIDQVESEFAAK